MMGIDTIIGLASLAIAVPGLVQTMIHAAGWLSEKLRAATGLPEIAEMQDFLLFLDRGMMRSTCEMAEDLYADTSDAAVKSDLEAITNQLWSLMIELEQHIRKINTSSYNEKQVAKAAQSASNTISQVRRLEFRLREYTGAHISAAGLRSRFEFRETQFCLIGEPKKISYSTVSSVIGEFDTFENRDRPCIIEDKEFPGLSAAHAYKSAVDLARTLQLFSDSSGTLQMIGFKVEQPSPLTNCRFRFVFAFPKNRLNPRSLRDIFLDPINKPIPPIPRNYRFLLPRQLVEAIFHIHQSNLVHKCIRPECILLFGPSPGDGPELQYPKVIGAPALVHWEYVRKTAEVSRRQVHDDWTMALYQHPERQAPHGTVAESKYNIGHDIYSFGVCLLEIGLWDSFIVYENGRPSICPLLSRVKTEWMEENKTACKNMTDSQIEQKVFITLAGDRLAYEMGEGYSKLVIKCLTCLEKGFGNVVMFVDSSSRDWEEQGQLFIQQVRRELASASMLGSQY